MAYGANSQNAKVAGGINLIESKLIDYEKPNQKSRDWQQFGCWKIGAFYFCFYLNGKWKIGGHEKYVLIPNDKVFWLENLIESIWKI